VTDGCNTLHKTRKHTARKTSEYQNIKTSGTYYYHCFVKGPNINLYYSMVYLHKFLMTLTTQRCHDRQ